MPHRCIVRNQVNIINEKAEVISRNRMKWLSGDRHILQHDASKETNLPYYNR